jgi:putative ATPase
MRPRTLEEFLGQKHLLGEAKPLVRLIEQDNVPSMILWGPPGSGKTTLGMLIADATAARFVAFSAVLAGVKEVRAVVEEAKFHATRGRKTILFVDEIHRFNKAQQDAFLPHVESGVLTLIGATTENPSFEVNAALLSRCRVFTLEALLDADILTLVDRAISDEERGLGGRRLHVGDEARKTLVAVANGDARIALNLLETAAGATPSGEITGEVVRDVAQSGKMLLFDKGGEEHYNLISALHKALRGSDADAALYWLARMLEAGADPLYVARRLVRFASEDVGNADPGALALAMAARDAVHFIGMPEGKLALAQAVTYLATAPKSNAVTLAYGAAAKEALETRSDPVPLHIRNAPTRLMQDLGYGRDYQYDHDSPDAYSGQSFFPPALEGHRYYHPVERGFEREIRRRLEYWARLKRERGT